jgi:hypothetical protein
MALIRDRYAQTSLHVAAECERVHDIVAGIVESRWTLNGGDPRRIIESMAFAGRAGALLIVETTGSRSPTESVREEECARLRAAWDALVAASPPTTVGRRAGWSKFEFALDGSRTHLAAQGRQLLAALNRVPDLAGYHWHLVFIAAFAGEPERTFSCDPGYDLQTLEGETAIAWVEPCAAEDWRESARYPTVTFLKIEAP